MLKIDGIRGNDVYLVGDVELKSGEECFSKVIGDNRLFVRKTNIEGIFQYGSEQLCDDFIGHKKGYIWASRASVMNKAFDIALTEAYYKVEGSLSYTCCSIDFVRFEQMLKEVGYEVQWTPIENTEYDLDYGLKKLSNA